MSMSTNVMYLVGCSLTQIIVEDTYTDQLSSSKMEEGDSGDGQFS